MTPLLETQRSKIHTIYRHQVIIQVSLPKALWFRGFLKKYETKRKIGSHSSVKDKKSRAPAPGLAGGRATRLEVVMATEHKFSLLLQAVPLNLCSVLLNDTNTTKKHE